MGNKISEELEKSLLKSIEAWEICIDRYRSNYKATRLSKYKGKITQLSNWIRHARLIIIGEETTTKVDILQYKLSAWLLPLGWEDLSDIDSHINTSREFGYYKGAFRVICDRRSGECYLQTIIPRKRAIVLCSSDFIIRDLDFDARLEELKIARALIVESGIGR